MRESGFGADLANGSRFRGKDQPPPPHTETHDCFGRQAEMGRINGALVVAKAASFVVSPRALGRLEVDPALERSALSELCNGCWRLELSVRSAT